MSTEYFPFPSNHWSTDWDMLDGISKEFQSLRELYRWSARAQDKTVLPHFKSIIENQSNSNIIKLHRELGSDPILMRYLEDCIESRNSKWPSQEIRKQLYLRINVKVWRNSSNWILNRNEDQRWAYFLNRKNLLKDIERTENVLRAIKPTQNPTAAPSTSDSEILVVSNDVEIAGCYDHGYDFASEVFQIVDKGKASRLEGKIFLDWYLIADDEECNQRIAAKYDLAIAQLYEILNKFLACLPPNPSDLAAMAK